MKKIFTLFSMLLALTTAMAQEVDNTFQFTDLEGNPVEDGTVITVKTLNEEGQMVVPLRVKNNSGSKAAVSMYENIDAKPNGGWQTCAFGNCMMLSGTGYSPKNVVSANYDEGIQTEWIPEEGQYATWEATLQVHVFNIETKVQFGQITEAAGSNIIGMGPKVTIRFEYAPQQDTQQIWWGYVGADDQCAGLGTSTAESYNCASFFPGTNQVLAGKTIKAVRFMLLSPNVKSVKVWIAEKLPITLTQGISTIETVNVANPVTGINEVALTKPYTIGEKGIYVGYTFTIPSVATNNDAYPVATTGTDKEGALLLKTSQSMTTWQDLVGNGFGRLYLQMLLEGDVPYTNGAAFGVASLGECLSAVGGTAKVSLPIINTGKAPIQSLAYTITTNGVAGPEQHIDLGTAFNYGEEKNVAIELNGDETPGKSVKTITITKVNGMDNENATASVTVTMNTILKLVQRGIAVEEFTGTQCGWCPRGIAGMEKLRNKYGNLFVGAAVHGYANGTSDDAMYLTSWNTKYANIFSGSAPACQLNRAYGEIDPFYGADTDICEDFEYQLSIPAKVGIDLSGEWSTDSTKVTATAVLEALTEGETYTIEYALIADSLTGTGMPWNQSNYYYSYSPIGDPILDMFCKNGKYGQSTVKGWTFNDAVIATCYKSSKNQTTAPGTLPIGEPVVNTYTLSMPTNATLKKAITKQRVAIVAFVIDSNGTVANAAKFYMPGYREGDTQGITMVQTGGTSTEQRYSLEGRRLQGAKRGLNIIRMNDGTTRKVVVR